MLIASSMRHSDVPDRLANDTVCSAPTPPHGQGGCTCTQAAQWKVQIAPYNHKSWWGRGMAAPQPSCITELFLQLLNYYQGAQPLSQLLPKSLHSLHSHTSDAATRMTHPAAPPAATSTATGGERDATHPVLGVG